MSPTVSILLPGFLGAATVQTAIQSWRSEVGHDNVEVLVVCPDAQDWPDEVEPVVRYISCQGMALHEARYASIQAAHGDYVLVAEDHCLPEPGAMRVILRRIGEDWDVIGPRMVAGTAHKIASHASFFLGYGQWAQPDIPGPTTDLPGHNVVIRTSLLRERVETLIEELVVMSFLVRRLARDNNALRDPDWRMRHFDPISLTHQVRIFWAVGTGIGACRMARASLGLRLLFAVFFPVSMARHVARGFVSYLRTGKANNVPLTALLMMTLFGSIMGFAEAVGAVRGLDDVKEGIWVAEIKPVTAEAIAAG